MGIFRTDSDIQKALDIANELFDQGYPFVDSDGTKYYGEEAKARISNLTNKPLGVWGTVAPADILGVRGRMPITHYYQALNAMEAYVEEKLPRLARGIRNLFDRLEIIAEQNHNSLLYRIGPLMFKILGRISKLYLTLIGRRDTINEQYREFLSSKP